jgi:hypothetical protein
VNLVLFPVLNLLQLEFIPGLMLYICCSCVFICECNLLLHMHDLLVLRQQCFYCDNSFSESMTFFSYGLFPIFYAVMILESKSATHTTRTQYVKFLFSRTCVCVSLSLALSLSSYCVCMYMYISHL